MKLLRAQLDHMKIEKLEMYGKIQGLRQLLKNNGITDYDEELESLTGSDYSRFKSERSEHKDTHFEQSQANNARGPERSLSHKMLSKQPRSRPNLKGFASTRWSPANVKKIASQSVRFSNSLTKFGSSSSLKRTGDASEELPPSLSSKEEVGLSIDIISSSNSKETTKLQAIEEGGMVSNLCEDGEQLKSITPKKTPPQAPDMSPEANGLTGSISRKEGMTNEEGLQTKSMKIPLEGNDGDQAGNYDQDPTIN